MAPLLPARATVHLQGLPAGASAHVDPTDPYIGALLEAEWLVPLVTEAPRNPGGQTDEDVDG